MASTVSLQSPIGCKAVEPSATTRPTKTSRRGLGLNRFIQSVCYATSMYFDARATTQAHSRTSYQDNSLLCQQCGQSRAVDTSNAFDAFDSVSSRVFR